jgi:RNA polymerase sigma factor for flagellar operon FliA
MLDRQFLAPLRASAPVDGAVASRPASRLFSESRTGGAIEPLVKKEAGSDDGSGFPTNGGNGNGGGPRGRPPGSGDGPGADQAETGASPAAGSNAAQTPDAQTPEALEAAADALLAEAGPAATEEAPDLGRSADRLGYEAYGNTPSPGLTMSRDELVTRYAHLVKYVVGRLGVSVPGLFDHEDAMQAGVVGLLRAIDAYKPEAAASFESYAILRIRGSILDAVRSLDTVGRAGREAARAIQGAIRDLQHELGRGPTESEIAGRLGLPVARYRERLQAASVVTISLDEHEARDNDDESSILADNAPDPNAVDPAEEAARRDAIAGLVTEIGRLGQRSRMVLALYYQDEMTFKEIGQVLGVTESRVCQIHTEAILALRGRLVDSDVAARLGRRRARS